MSLEDEMMFIYNEVKEKNLQEKFDKQIAKMLNQSKHDHKEPIEYWKYALKRVKGWNPNK